MFKKYLIILLLQSTFGFSQSIERSLVTSAASNGSVNSSIQSNIGELMAETYINSSTILSQGFVQNDQLITSIKNSKIENNGRVFPNPVISDLNVELNLSDYSDLNIEVFDVFGKKQISEFKKDFFSRNSNFEMSFSNIIPGIYFVRIQSLKNEFYQVFKITKV